MPLNIKNKATHDAAKRLAELARESISQAVDTAIRERLERLEAERQKMLEEKREGRPKNPGQLQGSSGARPKTYSGNHG